MKLTEQQKIVLTEYLKHGGMAHSASYYASDAESVQDAEYGVEIVVITGGATLSATFPMEAFANAAAKKLVVDEAD